MRYLLDTNIISDLVRHPQGPIGDNIRRVGERAVFTSIIVAAELRYGVAKKKSPNLTTRIKAVLDALEVAPFESPAGNTYGLLRMQLENSGKPIGANDLLIAAHALTLGCTLVTDNEKEFARISDLRCENWLRS
jgi:tRNA(fMet)-specific endonuclease VapC